MKIQVIAMSLRRWEVCYQCEGERGVGVATTGVKD